MPAIVFPSSGQTVRVTASNDRTSNATSWYLNDLNILATTQNTGTNNTYTFNNETFNFGSFSTVKVFTDNFNRINFGSEVFTISGSNENFTDFASGYAFESNIITVSRATSQTRTFYFNNNGVAIGTIAKVRISGPGFEQETDVVANSNDSFTIAVPINWPLSFIGFTFTIGRFTATPVSSYGADIAVSTNTNQTFTISKPVGFPDVGSTLYAIIPYGIQNVAPISGIASTLTNSVIAKPLVKVSHAPNLVTNIGYTRNIKIDLKTDQTKNTFAFAKTSAKMSEPIVLPSRLLTRSTSTEIVFSSNFIRITGSDLIRNNDLSWYYNDANLINLNYSTSSFVTLSFINPNDPYPLGTFTKAKIVTPFYERIIDVVTNTNNTITVLQIGLELNQITGIYLGNPITVSNNRLTDTGAVANVRKWTVPTTGTKANFFMSVVDRPTIKITSSPARFIVDNFKITEKLKETIVIPSRSVTYNNFTATVYTDLIRVTGRSGVNNNFSSYYIFENDQLTLVRSTSSSVTLYFNNPNNNLPIGTIVSARVIGPKFDTIVSVQSYTTDSITVPNIFNFDSIEAGNSFNDISIRLGINFPGSRAILSDSNATPLIDRVKTSAISFPAVFLASKITSPGIVVKDPIPKLVHSDFKTNLKVVGEFRQFKTELTLKNLITVREPLVSPSRLVTYTNFTATTYTDLIKITGRSGTITDFTSNYIFDNNQLKLTRSTSSFVTLYFNNPNNNQPIGNIVTARVIGTKFDITVNVQNYTTDSITVPDVFSFENIESGNSLTDVYVRLGKNFSERRVSYSNSNVIPLIEKIKPLAAAFPNNLSSSKITVNTLLKEDTARLLSAGFKNIPKVVGEARTLRVENAAKSSVNLSEPIVLPSRLITRFISTATIYTDPIQITGRSGVSSNFTSYYIFENNQLTLSRSIGNFVTLYFVPPTTGVTLASFTIARLTGSNFDISVTIQSNTSDSITVPNIFNFDDLKSPGTINDLFVRLGRTVQDTEIRYSNANRVSLINYHKTPVEFNSQISITGKTKIKDRNFSTVETPRISTYKSIPSLRETANYQTQQITVSNTTATLLSQIINIGGVTKSTSTFVSYYINDLDTLSVSTQSTVTNTLLFDTTVPLGNTLPTSVKLFAYQIVNGVENLKYEIVLPIVSVTSNSVSVNWEVYEYRIKVQLITAVLVSGKTYNRYSSGLSVANLQKFRADKQTVFEINQIGKLSRQYEKLFSLPNNVTSSKFKQEIVIKGVERFIPQKTTIVTTSTATIVEPFAINVYGKTETTSTAVRWYYNEENILQTIPVGSNLVTLYFDGLPIYQKTSAPFIKLIAPNVNYEFIHPVISFTIDSVTIQDTGFIPSVSGMYFYWARIGQSYTYRYSDTGANPYLNSLKFVNFIDGVVSTATFKPATVNKNIQKFSFGTEIPRIGKTQSIPQLRDTLQVIGKTPVSVTSSSVLTYSTTPVIVYGVTANTSTFVSYYINESNTLVTIPSGTPLATLYLGNNPEYYRPLGTNVKIVNSNSGYAREFNIVSSTLDSVTILNPGDLPSASGTVIYYGSIQTNYPSVTYSDTNFVGRINYNKLADKFIEIRTDRSGLLKQSIFVRADSTILKQFSVEKKSNILKSSIEVPTQNKFITAPKLSETSIWQTPVYTVSTSSQILFYNPINVAGKTASTTTFVTYYTYEDNTITEIISTGSQKTLYLTEIIQPNQNYSHVKLQSYRIENGNENNIWEYVLPIQNITSSSVTVNFDGTLPDSYFRASLGKTLVNYRSNFIGSSNINVINTLKVNRVESFQSPRFSLLDKKVTVLRDLQPNNNFSSATYGQPKIKVAADKTFISTINITTTAAQVVFLEPVVISGNDLSTSTFVSTFINEYDILRSFNSTSSLITFYFNRTVGVTSDYTVARFTNFIWYDFTTTIVNVTSQSVTIVNPLTQPLPNGGLSAYLGKVWPGQTYRSITYDPALQIPNISTTKIKFNLGTLTSLEIPRQGKVQSSTVLRSDVAVNRFLTNIFKNIPQVRGERNSDPHRATSVTTSTSIVFDTTAYRVYGTDLTTSTAVNYYLNENNLITTYGPTTSTVKLYLGLLPEYLQPYGTHIKLVNDTGFNQQFTITNFTRDSVTIQLPQDFPSISNLTLYFGSSKSTELVSYNDTNTVPKINFKWGLWHSHIFQDQGQLQKSFISLREHVDRTRLSFLQKPVTTLKSSIEVPRSYKADKGIVLREISQYRNRSIISTTASSILYLGPFDVSGRLGSTSTFLSSYLFDSDIVQDFTTSATVTTLYFSNYIAPLTDNYSLVRVQGFDTAFDLPLYEYTFAVSTFTNNTVSFIFNGILPGSRYKVYLGRPITSTTVNFTDGNNIPVFTKLKAYQGFNSIEAPAVSVMQKPVTVVKDFVSNIRLGQARSITKLVQDRSYQSTPETTVYSTTTVYTDPVVISGINRSVTNFVQDYINDLTGLVTVTNNTASLITLYFAQNIGYSGLHNTVKIVRYSSGAYLGNRFIIGPIEFENSYPIVSYTTSSVTINADAGSFIDPNIRSLAAYLGQSYQQPSSTVYKNTSTLSVPIVNKLVTPATGFALQPYSSKFNVSAKVKSLTTPITFSSINKNVVKIAQDSNRLQTGITLKSAIVVKDGFFPNLNLRTRTVSTATSIVYEPTVYRIVGTDLTTSTYTLNYTFDYDLFYTDTKNTSTITLYLGQLPVINEGLGLYVRITDNGSFNTTTAVISRSYGSVVINTPVNMPSISTLSLYFGAMRYSETVNYTDNNTNIIDSVFTQTSVRTSAAPSNARERLYYAGLAPSRYGSQITVYHRDLVSPVNLIPQKTGTLTTSTGVIWNTQAFGIYGTNLNLNTNLDWYTYDANTISFVQNPFIIVLRLGRVGASYGPGYFNQFTHIRLINGQTGYDQYFPIVSYSDETIGIATSPSSFPSISGLQAYFGYEQLTEQIIWDDQGLVPTFSSGLSFNTVTATITKIVLTENGIIRLPYKFTIANRIKESENLLARPPAKIDQAYTASIFTYIPVNARPTNPREILALLSLAPGLRNNRTITQGLTFSDFGNNLNSARLKTSITIKSTPRIENVSKIESANTATTLTTGINASPKSILYYTNIAPGIRGGTYYNASAALGLNSSSELGYYNRFVGVNDVIPRGVNFLVDRFPLRTVPFTSRGNLEKSSIPLRQIQSLFDRTGLIRIIPSMRADNLRSTVEFINKPKLDQSGWNLIEVRATGTLDKKLTIVKSGDLRNFTTDKLTAGIKVTADTNRFLGDSKISILQKLQTPTSQIRLDLIDRTKIPKGNVQFFETPSAANIGKSNIIVRDLTDNIKFGKANLLNFVRDPRSRISLDYIEKLKLVKNFQQIVEVPVTYNLGRMNLVVKDPTDNIKLANLKFTTNLRTPIYYNPISFTEKQKFLDFKQIRFDIDRGRLDTVNKLITSQLSTITSSIEKPLVKIAFNEGTYLLTTPKIGKIGKDLTSIFAADLGTISTSKPLSLQALIFDTAVAKVSPYIAIKSPINLDLRYSGFVKRFEKIGLASINFQDVAKIKFSPQGIKEPVDIQIAVSPKGLITKFIAGKSGNLQEPSTRKTVPVQFWN